MAIISLILCHIPFFYKNYFIKKIKNEIKKLYALKYVKQNLIFKI